MKYVVVGDIHGDYTALAQALVQAEFEPQEDVLITLGDIFDRGNENVKVFEFLRSLPHHIMIRGNHDIFLWDCLTSRRVTKVDDHNGTTGTIAEFAGMTTSEVRFNLPAYDKVNRQLTPWLMGESVWYYETPHYIFVHGRMPIDSQYNYVFTDLDKVEDWQWYDACCGETPQFIDWMHMHYPSGCGKTIVFGHWGTFLLHQKYNNINANDYHFGRWVDAQHGLIGLDTTTVWSHMIDPLVIPEEEI